VLKSKGAATQISVLLFIVMPAKAGIQRLFWTPAFAGVTINFLTCSTVQKGESE
jgi:hypothetical protein